MKHYYNLLLCLLCVSIGVSKTYAQSFTYTDTCLTHAVLFTAPPNSCDTALPVTYAWSFGDGGTSALANPAHTYAATGNYTVQLISSDSCATDTFSQTLHVICCQPLAYLNLPDSVCLTDSFTIHYGGAAYYKLSAYGVAIGIPNTGGLINSIRLPNYLPVGVYPFQLIVGVDSLFTCTDTVSANLRSGNCCNISAYLTLPDSICYLDSFQVYFGGGNYYQFIIDGAPDDGGIFDADTAVVSTTFNDLPPGTHMVQLIVANDSTFSCSDTASFSFVSVDCCTASAYLTIADTLCYMDTFSISFGGGNFYKFIIDDIHYDIFPDSQYVAGIDTSNFLPGIHYVTFIAGADTNLVCADTLYFSFVSVACCPQSLHAYLNIKDTICYQQPFSYSYGGGIYYQQIIDGTPGSVYMGYYDYANTNINTFLPGNHQLDLVVSLDSGLTCTDTISKSFYSAADCAGNPCGINGYFIIPDTICLLDSFLLQYGGGHYYQIILNGQIANSDKIYEYEELENSKYPEGKVPPGHYFIQLVVSMDSSYTCNDTVSTELEVLSCCNMYFKINANKELCALDTVCYKIYGGTNFSMYADSVTPGSYLFAGNTPFDLCGAVPASATEGYHDLIVVIYHEDSLCADTLSQQIYIKPACACGVSPVDVCPAMEATFSYDIFPGYIMLHDLSKGSPTYVEWYVGGKSFVTGPGDTLRYNFQNSGEIKVCLSAHHLIFGSSICCVEDTCIKIYGTVDTCDILNLKADFSYNQNLSAPYTYNFYPMSPSAFPVVTIWNFGDSTADYNYTSEVITHSYDTSGIYTVCVSEIWLLPGNYCCIDTQCYQVYVYPVNPEMRVMPNPFKQSASFKFKIATPGNVELSLINNLGQVVAVLLNNQYYTDGYFEKEFNLGNLANGMYTYRFRSGDGVLSGKILKQ